MLYLIFKFLIILDIIDIFIKVYLMLSFYNRFWYVRKRFEIGVRNESVSLLF